MVSSDQYVSWRGEGVDTKENSGISSSEYSISVYRDVCVASDTSLLNAIKLVGEYAGVG
jgi:hypothetical protein